MTLPIDLYLITSVMNFFSCFSGGFQYLKKLHVGQKMSSEKFNELGLTFKTLTPRDFDEICEFLMLYFFPDEPITRSTKLLEGSGIINKYISSLVKKHMIDPCLKDEVSVAAYNKDGEIIGVRYIKISKLSEISLKTIVALLLDTLESLWFIEPRK